MSNKVIVAWGFIIVFLVLAVYFIGIKYQNELKFVTLKNEIKKAAEKYIKDKDVSIPVVITTETLESEGYIKELKLNEKICAADINVSKKFLFYNYDIDFLCINPEA